MQKAKGVKKMRSQERANFQNVLGIEKLPGIICMAPAVMINKYTQNNKRWILLDGIRSLPYGHWRIKAYQHYVDSEMQPEIAEEKAMSVTLRSQQ